MKYRDSLIYKLSNSVVGILIVLAIVFAIIVGVYIQFGLLGLLIFAIVDGIVVALVMKD